MAHSDAVYSLEVDFDNCKTFVPVEAGTIRCKGIRLDVQQPLQVVPDDEDTGVPLCDVSLLNVGSFVVSNDLYEYLKPHAGDTVQFIELNWDAVRLWLCNVVCVVDCLDKEQSEMNPFGGVSKPVFDMNKVPVSGFFKIEEDNFTGIYLGKATHEALIQYEPRGVVLEAL